jgi:hypothetical protein
LHDELSAQRATHRPGIEVSASVVLVRSRTADNADPANLPECRRELVTDTVGQVHLRGIATDIDEWDDDE